MIENLNILTFFRNKNEKNGNKNFIILEYFSGTKIYKRPMITELAQKEVIKTFMMII